MSPHVQGRKLAPSTPLSKSVEIGKGVGKTTIKWVSTNVRLQGRMDVQVAEQGGGAKDFGGEAPPVLDIFDFTSDIGD